MHCILDIARFRTLLIKNGSNVYSAAMEYYGTDSAPFALKCLGVDLTCSAREAQALAGYVLAMSQRGCSPDHIARFLTRYASRLAHDERMPGTGWRVYAWMHRDTRLRWEAASETRLKAV